MATQPNTPSGANAPHLSPARANAALQTLLHFPREDLANFVSVAIDLLDTLDGDPDVEANGDELDGSLGEDDFCGHNAGWHGQPGCPIADPDCAADDLPCDDLDQDREPEEDADEFCDRQAYSAQKARIQRYRCFPKYYSYRARGERVREVRSYVLFAEPTVPTRRQLLRRKRGLPRQPRG